MKNPTSPCGLALENVCRHVGALLYGDAFETPDPRFSHYTQALQALDDEVGRLRDEIERLGGERP